jgi:hypothetical protein
MDQQSGSISKIWRRLARIDPAVANVIRRGNSDGGSTCAGGSNLLRHAESLGWRQVWLGAQYSGTIN